MAILVFIFINAVLLFFEGVVFYVFVTSDGKGTIGAGILLFIATATYAWLIHTMYEQNKISKMEDKVDEHVDMLVRAKLQIEDLKHSKYLTEEVLESIERQEKQIENDERRVIREIAEIFLIKKEYEMLNEKAIKNLLTLIEVEKIELAKKAKEQRKEEKKHDSYKKDDTDK